MRKLLLMAAVAAGLLLLASCDLLAGHSAPVRQVFDEMLVAGKLTPEQHAALMAALNSGDWSRLWELAATAGLSMLGGWLGITPITNAVRGKITARKGAAPK